MRKAPRAAWTHGKNPAQTQTPLVLVSRKEAGLQLLMVQPTGFCGEAAFRICTGHRFDPRPGAFQCSVMMFSLCLVQWLPATEKTNMHEGQLENSKLSGGVSVSANGCLSVCVAGSAPRCKTDG